MRRLLPILAVALALPASAAASTQSFGGGSPSADSLSPRATLHKAQTALEKGRGVSGGSEVTPLLKQLALKLPRLEGAERKRAIGLLARPSQGQGSSNELEYETAEQKPVCSEHYCIHWVRTTDDAPPLADGDRDGVPDYVETMSDVFEHVYAVENVELGWRPPTSDGNRGCVADAENCAGKTDVYIKEIGSQGIYGYAAPDPQQRSYSQAAYLVMDDDYNASQFPRYQGDPLQPMEVTAAHEYNHVLQFGYDTAQDTWMFESTATWMEDRVYTDVNDYLQYLTSWTQMTFVPLTYFSTDGNDPLNVKVYGDSVWNRWLEARFGDDAIRDAWAASRKTTPKDFAPEAYGRSLMARNSSFFRAFSTFAADTAEWRASNTAFEEGQTFPDVDRAASNQTGRPITLTADRAGAVGRIPHTAYILLDVHPPADAPQLRLAVNTPRGTRMAIALVGRTGDEVNGESSQFLKLLPKGGPGLVTIDNPAQYGRLTAAVINSDTSQSGYSRTLRDWVWRKDSEAINARVSTDSTAPSVKGRAPRPGTRRASTRTRIKVTFTERLFELTSKSVRLVGPGGRSVKTKLGLSRAGRKVGTAQGADQVVLTPRARLARGKRYEVRLSRDLRDFGGNALPSSALKWTFVTKR